MIICIAKEKSMKASKLHRAFYTYLLTYVTLSDIDLEFSTINGASDLALQLTTKHITQEKRKYGCQTSVGLFYTLFLPGLYMQ